MIFFLLRLSCVAVNNIISSFFFFLPKALWPCVEVSRRLLTDQVYFCVQCAWKLMMSLTAKHVCVTKEFLFSLCVSLFLDFFLTICWWEWHLQPPFNEKRHSKIILSAVEDFVSLSSMVYWERGLSANRNTVKQTAKKAKISSVTKLWLILRYYCDRSGSGMVWNLTGRIYMLHLYGQAAVTYRFPLDHRKQAPSSGASTWMGDHPGTPRAVGNVHLVH